MSGYSGVSARAFDNKFGGGGRRAAPLERQAAENPYAAGVVSRPAPGSRRCSFASEQGCTYEYRNLEQSVNPRRLGPADSV